MIEAAMRVGRDDAIGKTKIDQDAWFDRNARRVFGSEIVVNELDAGLDGIQRFIENHRVAWNQLEQDCVSVQSAPRLPAERRGFSDALFVYFDAIQDAIAFHGHACIGARRPAEIAGRVTDPEPSVPRGPPPDRVERRQLKISEGTETLAGFVCEASRNVARFRFVAALDADCTRRSTYWLAPVPVRLLG